MTTHDETEELDYEIRSEAVQEILGYVPHWMINWGNTLILILALGLFLLSYFIQYPNTIKTTAVLTTEKPSKNIYAPITGDIQKIFVSDGARVNNGQLIGTIKNMDVQKKLISSVDGNIYFVDFLKEDISLAKGNHLFSIVPNDHEYYKASIKIPSEDIINVVKGQEVRLYLHTSEVTKHDPIIGFVAGITSIPDIHGQIALEVKLQDALITSNGQKIDYRPGIKGEALIITEDLRLIERFFYQLKNMF